MCFCPRLCLTEFAGGWRRRGLHTLPTHTFLSFGEQHTSFLFLAVHNSLANVQTATPARSLRSFGTHRVSSEALLVNKALQAGAAVSGAACDSRPRGAGGSVPLAETSQKRCNSVRGSGTVKRTYFSTSCLLVVCACGVVSRPDLVSCRRATLKSLLNSRYATIFSVGG